MKYFTIAFLLALIALCAVLFFLPGKIRTVSEQAKSGYGVAATTYPIWVLTREVLDGTGIEAQLLTPPDAGCPHDYVLTANDLMKVSAARSRSCCSKTARASTTTSARRHSPRTKASW